MNKVIIDDISKYAKKIYPTSKILPSVITAQAILESGWGSTPLATRYNNYFGLNWYNDNVCAPYEWVEYATEQERDGKLVDSVERFCIFKNYKESVECLVRWYTLREKYADIIGNTDYVDVCRKIKSNGYATDSKYADKLIRIIVDNRLYELDETRYYRVYCGSYVSEVNAYNRVANLVEHDFDAFVKKVGDNYRVQVGAFTKRENADRCVASLKAIGYESFIEQEVIE